MTTTLVPRQRSLGLWEKAFLFVAAAVIREFGPDILRTLRKFAEGLPPPPPALQEAACWLCKTPYRGRPGFVLCPRCGIDNELVAGESRGRIPPVRLPEGGWL